MTDQPPEVQAPPAPPARMSDQDVVDDHLLRRERLRGSLVRGRHWRQRPEMAIHRRLLVSFILGAVALGVVMAVGFLQAQLTKQAKAKASASATAVVTTVAPTPSASGKSPVPSKTP